VVHHANKGGQSYRGSTMLATTFEAELGLMKNKASVIDPSGTTSFRTEWRKFRGRRDASLRDRSVKLEDTPQGARWVWQATAEDVLETIAEMVRSGEYGSQEAVRKALPEHLWPNPGSRPVKQWISKQFALMDANGVLSDREVSALFKAASGRDFAPTEDTSDDDL